uniref:Uncharacterized protein n=1 Tax=Anopheles atroparvus TaxID=41427 RepID=A0AAG5DGP4_ANOAO
TFRPCISDEREFPAQDIDNEGSAAAKKSLEWSDTPTKKTSETTREKDKLGRQKAPKNASRNIAMTSPMMIRVDDTFAFQNNRLAPSFASSVASTCIFNLILN